MSQSSQNHGTAGTAVAGPFTARDLVVGIGVILLFLSSVLPLEVLRGIGVNLWNSAGLFQLALGILLPAVVLVLFVVRRLAPQTPLRIGSLSVDQFASVVASLALAFYFLTIVTVYSVSGIIGFIGALVLFAGTVCARWIPQLAADFVGPSRDARPTRWRGMQSPPHPGRRRRSRPRSIPAPRPPDTGRTLLASAKPFRPARPVPMAPRLQRGLQRAGTKAARSSRPPASLPRRPATERPGLPVPPQPRRQRKRRNQPQATRRTPRGGKPPLARPASSAPRISKRTTPLHRVPQTGRPWASRLPRTRAVRQPQGQVCSRQAALPAMWGIPPRRWWEALIRPRTTSGSGVCRRRRHRGSGRDNDTAQTRVGDEAETAGPAGGAVGGAAAEPTAARTGSGLSKCPEPGRPSSRKRQPQPGRLVPTSSRKRRPRPCRPLRRTALTARPPRLPRRPLRSAPRVNTTRKPRRSTKPSGSP